MRAFRLCCVASLIALAVVSTGWLSAQTGDPDPEMKTNATVRAEVPLDVPAAERARKNPNPVTPESLSRGGELFASQCAMCHGMRGEGAGELARKLGMKVPDLTKKAVQQSSTEGEWYYVLNHGHGSMPIHDRLPDELKWEMVSYLRTLGGE